MALEAVIPVLALSRVTVTFFVTNSHFNVFSLRIFWANWRRRYTLKLEMLKNGKNTPKMS